MASGDIVSLFITLAQIKVYTCSCRYLIRLWQSAKKKCLTGFEFQILMELHFFFTVEKKYTKNPFAAFVCRLSCFVCCCRGLGRVTSKVEVKCFQRLHCFPMSFMARVLTGRDGKCSFAMLSIQVKPECDGSF